MNTLRDFPIQKKGGDIIGNVFALIGIAIAYIVILHLVKTGQKELAKRKQEDDVVIKHTTIEDSELTNEKPLAFTYVNPQVVAPKVEKKKGGFISKELLRSYLSYQIDKDK